MADQFESIIDCIETKYNCIVIYFTTDSDGGSKKGCQLLEKQRPWLLAPSCWAHQFQLVLRVYIFAAQIVESATDLIGWLNNHGKVRKMFDASQAQISLNQTGQSVVLAYLTANLTQWTTHCVAFIRLLRVQDALKLEVMQHRSGLIKAQDAEMHCDLIADYNFREGLEHVVGDIEPICYRTNINQKDST
ncbi:hypothetical protein PILCRDRAFT_14572 [Piloderma croceum F 1598]|uniref:DUF659 domain-containing protein n=1 Tax=Piloderma croceum (strain F 1598) TaxID=765440 RepID=A0A0C3BA67_PILCF|nr:hypothetical protein PILCRDRAFT_14572 [Piloderma croceum F 1598]